MVLNHVTCVFTEDSKKTHPLLLPTLSQHLWYLLWKTMAVPKGSAAASTSLSFQPRLLSKKGRFCNVFHTDTSRPRNTFTSSTAYYRDKHRLRRWLNFCLQARSYSTKNAFKEVFKVHRHHCDKCRMFLYLAKSSDSILNLLSTDALQLIFNIS